MFLFNLLFLAFNIVVVAMLFVAATRLANHVRKNPAGMQALVEHLFVPVFRPHQEAKEEEPAAPAGWRSVEGEALAADGVAEAEPRNR